MPGKRVLLIGWDAADWKVIRPLLKAGKMPNLARLMAGGVHGNIATIYPVLSPMLWTSIATGKRAYKHGIHGFSEPLPNGAGVQPISLLSRKTKAVWNILNQTGRRSVVVGWWPSHPAEPINGVMVSNQFEHALAEPGQLPPLPPGAVHPASLADSLGELRVNPAELTGEFLRLFVPDYHKVDQGKDKRLHSLARIIAETMSVHAAATELLQKETWDFAAIYYSGIDHFGHAFMSYHPPRLPWVSEKDFEVYRHVIENAYRYHDAMLGTLLTFADQDTTVILMSDHGFHPDHLRTGYIPAEPAGPAVEHRHFGILCLRGPGLRAGEPLYGASLLDICPTILTLFGLPPGKDMDGKVLLTAFKEAQPIEPIESWDAVPGDAGLHPPETRLDPAASAQAFKQLVDLGYVAPPGPKAEETVDECVRELKYNLARAYGDGNRHSEAAALASELWERWPKEHRFGFFLIDCLAPLGEVARRRAAIEELARRLDRYQGEAAAELARRGEHKANKAGPGAARPQSREQRDRFEERQLRELACGRPWVLDWLQASQAILEKQPAEARRHLEKFAGVDIAGTSLSPRVAAALAELDDLDSAVALLQTALKVDPENAPVHAQLAAIHLKAGRCKDAVESATESLSLVYFQPGIHALLGQALMEEGRFPEAEKALLVAVSQSPRNLIAHELLGRLYRQHLERPADAFAHEGRARSLQNELQARRRKNADAAAAAAPDAPAAPRSPRTQKERTPDPMELPAPFGPEVDPRSVIVVVSGLPRSGTSMMMQLLSAAGRQALTDGKRAADPDNPLGYFEFERALNVARDVSWLPEARGKAVKLVAQLLPRLPRDEHYRIILMERDLPEVIASQTAMLARKNRPGSGLRTEELEETYAAQLRRVRNHLARRPEIRTLRVNYGELIAHPADGVARLARFLGEPFQVKAAVESIHPELRHQHAPAETVPEPSA